MPTPLAAVSFAESRVWQPAKATGAGFKARPHGAGQ
jgi:hypothetical protein